MINVIKQQESSPFTSVGKSFEKNYILNGFYICVHLMISMLHAF